MPTKLDSTFFKNNRKNLINLNLKNYPIVLVSNGLIQSSGEIHYPFKQDASFWYLTGLNLPDLILVIDEDQEYIIAHSKNKTREIFEGKIEFDLIRNTSGIEKIYNEKEGWQKLLQLIEKNKRIATLPIPPKYIDYFGFYTNPAKQILFEKLKYKYPKLKFVDISKDMIKLRSIKQPVEINLIQKAIDLTTESLEKVIKNIKANKYDFEYQIEAELFKSIRSQGLKRFAYDPIIASGKNACIIHYSSNESKLNKSQLLLIDVGAEVDNYSADITRTISISKKPNQRQLQVFNAVIEIQQFAFSILKPGVIIKEYETQIENFVHDKLAKLNLIKSKNKKQIRKYYPHLTSHFLGLNVHDVGEYSKPLKENMVLTVEPGIYINEEGIGIRIEDDVLITKNGYKILSQNLPKTL
ncbi:MAG TPA: Xaa-Pro aminopeptidase [Patescibacteria group bacterium]|nr:Xaa-Pro aminopeptidase [Patescibacteria group bacterium]